MGLVTDCVYDKFVVNNDKITQIKPLFIFVPNVCGFTSVEIIH